MKFVEGDVQDGPPARDFDAVVGRNVLLHVTDPLNVVRAQAEALRPEGLMVVMEYGGSTLDTVGAYPPTPLLTQVCAWIEETAVALGCITALVKTCRPSWGMPGSGLSE